MKFQIISLQICKFIFNYFGCKPILFCFYVGRFFIACDRCSQFGSYSGYAALARSLHTYTCVYTWQLTVQCVFSALPFTRALLSFFRIHSTFLFAFDFQYAQFQYICIRVRIHSTFLFAFACLQCVHSQYIGIHICVHSTLYCSVHFVISSDSTDGTVWWVRGREGGKKERWLLILFDPFFRFVWTIMYRRRAFCRTFSIARDTFTYVFQPLWMPLNIYLIFYNKNETLAGC